MESLLDVKQSAILLGIKPSTIRRWIFDKRISTVKIGRSVRIKESELVRIVREGERPAMEMVQ